MTVTQTFNLEGLKQLQKSLELLAKSSVEVGVLSESPARGGVNSNAQVGMYMEYGSVNIPKRSWLYNSLQNNFTWVTQPYYDTPDFGTEFLGWLKEGALATVKNAFTTNGYGTWEPDEKAIKLPGIDTKQLYGSIRARIKTA